jgi:hypothetical protein
MYIDGEGDRGEYEGGGGGDMELFWNFGFMAEVVSQLASADTRYVLIKLNTNSDMRL